MVEGWHYLGNSLDYIDNSFRVGIQKWSYVLQYHLSGRYRIGLPLPLLLFETGYRYFKV